MTQRDQDILDLLVQRPDLAHPQISDILGLPEPSVRRSVRGLEKAGRVRCTGTHEGTGMKSWAAVGGPGPQAAAPLPADPEVERARALRRFQ